MGDGARISIDKVGDDGEPLDPIESRRKFINQCRVLVRDMLPIILEEWHKTKDDNKMELVMLTKEEKICFGRRS